MGTKTARTYVTLVMGILIKQLYQRVEQKYGQAAKMQFVKVFKRFLVDCFIFWKRSRAELGILFNKHSSKNSIHDGIQLQKATIFRHTDLLTEHKNSNGYLLQRNRRSPISRLLFMPSKTRYTQYTVRVSKRIRTIVTICI